MNNHYPLCYNDEWIDPDCDLLCPEQHKYNPLDEMYPDSSCRTCNLIAKVLEKERNKDLDYQYIAAQAEADGYRNALNDIVKQIESMLPITLRSLIHNKTRDAVYVDEVIAMIRGKLE